MDQLPADYPDPVFQFLYAYQHPHVLRLGALLDANNCINDGSDPGIGKTPSACALAKWKRRGIFVICPKPVIENWFAHASRSGCEILGVSNYELIKNGKFYPTIESYKSQHKVACPYVWPNGADYEWRLPDNALIVYDEAHKGKNHSTGNSQMLISTKKATNINGNGPKILLLSATLADSVDAFKTPAYLFGLAQLGKHAYAAWIRKICRENPGRQNIPEIIHDLIYPRFGSRIRIRDLKQDTDAVTREMFKENDIAAAVYPISPEEERQIAAAYNDIDDALTALKTKQRTETCPLVVILRARQRIELLKVPTFVMQAMEYLWNDFHVIIFVNFDETRLQIFSHLDSFVQDECHSFIAMIYGGQTPEDRAYNVNSFQENKARVIICNIRAGGVAISLHGRKRVSLISPTWSAIDQKQITGRPYRAGGESVIQRIIYCSGRVGMAGPENAQNDTTFNGDHGKVGVEELIAENVNKKMKTLEFLNNGDNDDLVLI